MKHFDTDTKELTLVTKVKNKLTGEVDTKTFAFPLFVEGFFTKKAVDLGAELEENEYVVDGDMFNKLVNYTVELYDRQFTAEELTNGIHQGLIINTFFEILFAVLQGDKKNE